MNIVFFVIVPYNLSGMSGAELQGSTEFSEAAQEASATALASFPKKKNRANIRKRVSDGVVEDAGEGAILKKTQRVKDASLAFTTKKDEKFETFKYESNNVVQQSTDQGATRQMETETQHDRDGRYALIGIPIRNSLWSLSMIS